MGELHLVAVIEPASFPVSLGLGPDFPCVSFFFLLAGEGDEGV